MVPVARAAALAALLLVALLAGAPAAPAAGGRPRTVPAATRVGALPRTAAPSAASGIASGSVGALSRTPQWWQKLAAARFAAPQLLQKKARRRPHWLQKRASGGLP